MLNRYAILALMCGKSRCRNNTELVSYCTIFSSAYTEPFPMNSFSALLSADEAHGRTSEEEEEGAGEPSCDRQVRYGTQTQMKGRRKWLIASSALPCSPSNQVTKQGTIISASFLDVHFSDMNKWRFCVTLTHLLWRLHRSGAADDKRILSFQNQTSLSNMEPPFLLLPHLAAAPIVWPTFSSFLLSSRQIYIKDDDQRDSNRPQEQFQLMELCCGKIRALKCSICKKPTGENTTLIKRRPIAGKALMASMFWFVCFGSQRLASKSTEQHTQRQAQTHFL